MGNQFVWQTPQQDSYFVYPLWSVCLSHSEESLCSLWIPQCQDPQVQLVKEGHQEEDHWHWKDAPYEESPAAIPQWIPLHCRCGQFPQDQRRGQEDQEGRMILINN